MPTWAGKRPEYGGDPTDEKKKKASERAYAALIDYVVSSPEGLVGAGTEATSRETGAVLVGCVLEERVGGRLTLDKINSLFRGAGDDGVIRAEEAVRRGGDFCPGGANGLTYADGWREAMKVIGSK